MVELPKELLESLREMQQPPKLSKQAAIISKIIHADYGQDKVAQFEELVLVGSRFEDARFAELSLAELKAGQKILKGHRDWAAKIGWGEGESETTNIGRFDSLMETFDKLVKNKEKQGLRPSSRNRLIFIDVIG